MPSSNQLTATDARSSQAPGIIKWVRANLFSNWFNSILTITLIPAVAYILFIVFRWVFISADWSAVTSQPLLFGVGQFPRDQIWRVGISLLSIMFLIGVSWGKWGGLLRSIGIFATLLFFGFAILPFQHEDLSIPIFTIASTVMTIRFFLGLISLFIIIGNFIGRLEAVSKRLIIIGWFVTPIITVILLSGFDNSELLPSITTTLWGGLLVTFLLAFGGIILSFPIGVALALGRRSKLPVVSAFSTIFIEMVRGVPLVTILFMFSFIINLVLPPSAIPERIVRALMAMTLFSAAYTAENIRGGLQAVPPGQMEAAKAVGMSGFQTMFFIVLPQALRAILPAIVGQFISLFKDTTLVVIVGINDFLGIGRSIINSTPEFLQLQLEVYVFIAIIYMIFSFLMSLASRKLEDALGVGER
ncbi:MAG: amino acid ABC transporter permease [Chloroflexi bacterium]|nr:amino acid ABC transporter permease [Chloroflexota bacterium]